MRDPGAFRQPGGAASPELQPLRAGRGCADDTRRGARDRMVRRLARSGRGALRPASAMDRRRRRPGYPAVEPSRACAHPTWQVLLRISMASARCYVSRSRQALGKLPTSPRASTTPSLGAMIRLPGSSRPPRLRDAPCRLCPLVLILAGPIVLGGCWCSWRGIAGARAVQRMTGGLGSCSARPPGLAGRLAGMWKRKSKSGRRAAHARWTIARSSSPSTTSWGRLLLFVSSFGHRSFHVSPRISPCRLRARWSLPLRMPIRYASLKRRPSRPRRPIGGRRSSARPGWGVMSAWAEQAR